MTKKQEHIDPVSMLEEQQSSYGFTHKSEEERLREDVFRPDMEKLQLFTRMLRKNALLKKAVITHHS